MSYKLELTEETKSRFPKFELYMCSTKYWQRIHAAVATDGIAKITATRSDNVLIKLNIEFPERLTSYRANEILVKSLQDLESYRNCNCDLNKTCDFHIKQEKENK